MGASGNTREISLSRISFANCADRVFELLGLSPKSRSDNAAAVEEYPGILLQSILADATIASPRRINYLRIKPVICPAVTWRGPEAGDSPNK